MKTQDVDTCVTVPPDGIGGSFRIIFAKRWEAAPASWSVPTGR